PSSIFSQPMMPQGPVIPNFGQTNTISRVIEPLPPANPIVFGPQDNNIRTIAPLANPLPQPPKDIYETEEYRSLLNTLPGSDLFRGGYNLNATVRPEIG